MAPPNATTKLDHYCVLEFEPGTVIDNVSVAEVKKAYRKMALKFHPDKGHVAATVLFRRVQEAYETLGDTRSKNDYDRFYARYYKRRSVTAQAIEKEAKARNRIIADILVEASREKAKDEMEEVNRKKEELERKRAEELKKKRTEEEARRKAEKQERLRKEAERRRKIEEKEKREREVLERRRQEEQQRAEERRKQAEFEEIQSKIRIATEEIRRKKNEQQKEPKAKTSQKSDHNMNQPKPKLDFTSLPSDPEERRKKTNSLKEKIMKDREKLRERRSKSQKPAEQSPKPKRPPYEEDLFSEIAYHNRLRELKTEFQFKSEEKDDIIEKASDMESMADKMKVSAKRALEKAQRKFDERMKRAEQKIADAQKLRAKGENLRNQMDETEFKYDSLVDKYQTLYGKPDLGDNKKTTPAKSSASSRPGSAHSTPRKSTRCSSHNMNMNNQDTSPPGSEAPKGDFNFEFSSTMFSFAEMKENLPRPETQRPTFDFSMNFEKPQTSGSTNFTFGSTTSSSPDFKAAFNFGKDVASEPSIFGRGKFEPLREPSSPFAFHYPNGSFRNEDHRARTERRKHSSWASVPSKSPQKPFLRSFRASSSSSDEPSLKPANQPSNSNNTDPLFQPQKQGTPDVTSNMPVGGSTANTTLPSTSSSTSSSTFTSGKTGSESKSALGGDAAAHINASTQSESTTIPASSSPSPEGLFAFKRPTSSPPASVPSLGSSRSEFTYESTPSEASTDAHPQRRNNSCGLSDSSSGPNPASHSFHFGSAPNPSSSRTTDMSGESSSSSPSGSVNSDLLGGGETSGGFSFNGLR
ncbi:Reticulocyte-binding protein 2 a [Cyberlindnera fabianii]|uniref:Reticulocyte-binding protein 2 a n=1 Tax=Cyberlindnera fabianii TaxID=36022 RepID=A0A1V2L832_CYBFA|nr:Reticulocyte-binding protein 2 a [Cyberlindnera fabianii]